MPTGPKGQKRPADVIGNAVKVMRIATGEEEDTTNDARRLPVGNIGGKARAKKLSPERRSEIAKEAAKARWRVPAAPSEEEEL